MCVREGVVLLVLLCTGNRKVIQCTGTAKGEGLGVFSHPTFE